MTDDKQPVGLVASGLWRRLAGTGLERFELHREASGWLLRGTILMASRSETAEARYEVHTDAAWITRAASVHVRDVAGERSLRLVVDRGRWYAGDRELEALRECVDVDLQWSPVTNTLPMRRLGLAVGQNRAVPAAWVRFPDLELEPLAQEYLRLTERRYRYSSAQGSFVAEVDVDDDALVVEYSGQWQRVGNG